MAHTLINSGIMYHTQGEVAEAKELYTRACNIYFEKLGPNHPQTHKSKHDDDDVYYSKGRRPREDEEGEESYEKRENVKTMMTTWCVVLLKRHSSIVRVPGRYVLSSIDAIPSSSPLFQGRCQG